MVVERGKGIVEKLVKNQHVSESFGTFLFLNTKDFMLITFSGQGPKRKIDHGIQIGLKELGS